MTMPNDADVAEVVERLLKEMRQGRPMILAHPTQHWADVEMLSQALQSSEAARLAAERERDEARALLNSPELHDFAKGVVLEAGHQRDRWGADHDAGKAPEDWFWLIGYLGGKALHAAKTGDSAKALHHCISTAAALANWHAALLGVSTAMRPGIDAKERGVHVDS